MSIRKDLQRNFTSEANNKLLGTTERTINSLQKGLKRPPINPQCGDHLTP